MTDSLNGDPSRPLVGVLGFLGLLAIPVSLGLATWFMWLKPVYDHNRTYERVEASIEQLADRRPADISRRRWSYVVGWTLNGIGNCCTDREHIKDHSDSRERFRRFADELERRVNTGNITMDTIDWIWDEIAGFSRHGPRYSKHYRPTTPQRLADADQIPVGNQGPHVD